MVILLVKILDGKNILSDDSMTINNNHIKWYPIIPFINSLILCAFLSTLCSSLLKIPAPGDTYVYDGIALLTHRHLWHLDVILKCDFKSCFLIGIFKSLFSSDENHGTSLLKRQNRYREKPVAVRQKTINWSNVDLGLYRHIASLGQVELIIVWYIWQ